MTTRTRMQLLDEGNFRALFVEELGWSRPDRPPLHVDVDGTDYRLDQVAGFRGIRVWVCPSVPDRRTQRLIDAQVRTVSNERLIVFTDGQLQEWRWPQSADVRGAGQPRLVTHVHHVGRPNPALDQRLQLVSIDIDEEPTVVELLRRLRSAFDADRVTKSFYDSFLKKHKDLVDALKGLQEKTDREWYSALLMNRLMFVYFMQRKSFMDGDLNYLRNRLDGVRELLGQGHFYEFFKDFLLPLFHESLGAHEGHITDERIMRLVGDVPYINGGIFAVHALEANNDLSVPDHVFEAIFDLFDSYQWHLDDRPTGNPNEINPDVLGYIFEQFINQKEQGAYYTKEDVTHFMTASTLLPVFLERLQRETGVNPWVHVATDPDRYLWESLSFGVRIPLPDDVAEESGRPSRPAWSQRASEDCGLPGETWWEVAHRRGVYEAVARRCRSGQIDDVDTAISANLDLESLALDVIDHLDSPADVVAAWNIISGLKVIDPTCGSGAFLFAALKILQSLYTAVLDVAAVHASTSHDPELRTILDTVAAHSSQDYFVLKHAALANLHGVDLMHEAVEIARLRLFLKLVSTIDRRSELEPLPDLDFNIKPGNILVGALKADDIRAYSDDIFSSSTADDVAEAAQSISEALGAFRSSQESPVPGASRSARERSMLQHLLDSARGRVDQQYHAREVLRRLPLKSWVQSHQPFHWFLEFPEVMGAGGFDVVIGNPPYINKNKVTSYTYRGFEAEDLPDIFAPCTERASQILKPDGGRLALVLPISCQFSEDFRTLRLLLEHAFSHIWVSAFAERPSRLFKVKVRSSIVIGVARPEQRAADVRTTVTHSWQEAYRPHLLEALEYVPRPASDAAGSWTRWPSEGMVSLISQLRRQGSLAESDARHSIHTIRYKKTGTYYLSAYLNTPPSFKTETFEPVATLEGSLAVTTEREKYVVLAVLLSKLSFVWWTMVGDCFNVTKGTLISVPVSLRRMPVPHYERLVALGREIGEALPDVLLWDLNAGRYVGNYAIPELRHLTDQVDEVLLEGYGLSDFLEDLEYAYARVYKPTGASSTTVRELPVPPKGVASLEAG